MLGLTIPAFFAGLLTFLAPCTLPLVPAYLSFIGGVSSREAGTQDAGVRRRVVINGLFYVIGFSTVFIVLGSLFAAGGAVLVTYRDLLSRLGGLLVLFFGLFLLFGSRWRIFESLQAEHRFHLHHLTPGKPLSAFLFGATFAFGWTPCIGPILGSVLILAATTSTFFQGVFLLIVFSVGLGLPFILLAFAFGHAVDYVDKLKSWMRPINVLGGVLLVFLGILLLTDHLGLWLGWMFELFSFIDYGRLLRYL